MATKAAVFLLFAMVFGRCAIAENVRIGVLGLFHPSQIILRASSKEAVMIQAADETLALEPDSKTVATIRVSAETLLLNIGDRVLRTAEIHAAARNTGAVTFVLTVPGKMTRTYRGTLLVKVSNGEVVPIVTMDLETAVASAVAAESDVDASLESLKAQAVVARSYFVAGGGRHREFDFCDLTHCQFLREPPPEDGAASVAARETRSLVLVYQERHFAAMFSRSCGGRTLTPADLGLSSNGYPYFAVPCEACYRNPFRWSRRLSRQDAALVIGKGEAGRLAVDRRLGWNAVPSNNFTAREAGGEVVLQGVGQGHGIGLCQRGAKAMAREGQNFRQILDHYFPNTAVVQR